MSPQNHHNKGPHKPSSDFNLFGLPWKSYQWWSLIIYKSYWRVKRCCILAKNNLGNWWVGLLKAPWPQPLPQLPYSPEAAPQLPRLVDRGRHRGLEGPVPTLGRLSWLRHFKITHEVTRIVSNWAREGTKISLVHCYYSFSSPLMA